MKVTFLGHSCFAIEIAGYQLLFDPFITPNPLAEGIDLSTIQPDFILISHGHEDHIADAIHFAQTTNATFIAAHEICMWLKQKGVANVHGMNIGGHFHFPFGKVKCVSAVHSSSLPDGTYGGSPMGFLIESNQGNFYYAGDTALHYDMKLIGDYKKLDFAFLPIGNNYTMGIDNAVIAADFIKCNTIIAMHYNTFESIKINTQEAIQKFENADLKLLLPSIGETLTF
jgi:L-ascorbate metabolism protein UlaG (beta-lactamase superfamily)